MSSDLYYGAPIDPMYPHSRRQQFYDSSIGRSTLPDVQFRVPMESRRDVDRVKDALDIDGVHGVNCDMVNQTVTVTGNVPYHRLLKKLKHVKRKSRLISFLPDNQMYNPSYGSYHGNPYNSSYGSSSFGGRGSIRRPLSPPNYRSTSYVSHPLAERAYYEDYEDYRPSRYLDY